MRSIAGLDLWGTRMAPGRARRSRANDRSTPFDNTSDLPDRGRMNLIVRRLSLAAALAVAAASLGGCGSGPPPRRIASEAHDLPVSARANDVLFRALGLVGTPYRYGGNTPESGFDCSGLVGFVFRDAAGLALPRSSRDIAEVDAPQVRRSRLAPGDLVFFGQRGVNHIGIYVGEGRFVHAPNSGGTVRLDALDGAYWKDSYLYAKRVLR